MNPNIHKLKRVCSNCYYWTANKVHPKSDYYPPTTCLERADSGHLYSTNALESCSRFARIKESNEKVEPSK
jgi:hypothetical protein